MRHPNRLLASLPAVILEDIAPHLSTAEIIHGDVLVETGGQITSAYFPHSGIISLVVELSEGEMLEIAMVGNDSVMGAASAMDGQISLNKAIVQGSGIVSLLDAQRLRELADRHIELRAKLIRHEQVLFAQAQQGAACNASHDVEARLCKWLLRMRDLAGDEFAVTQNFLGQMIGVRRTSVSLVAGALQSAGLIKYRRGRIKIVDPDGLEEVSCECHRTVKRHIERMLSDRRPGQ